MMKKEDIIASGMVEDYVLGLLSPEDRIKMEGYIEQYPSIADLVQNMDLSLEKIAEENRIQPRKELKDKIIGSAGSAPLPQKSSPSWGYLAAAFLAGCILTGALWGINASNKNRKIQALDQAYASLQSDCNERAKEFASSADLLFFLRHEATIPVPLKESSADLVMYHNSVAKLCMVHVRDLPQITADETFQMWADVDGEMINMGTFSSNEDFQDLEYILDPESFNVTIEPSGGSSHPTVSRLVVSAPFSVG